MHQTFKNIINTDLTNYFKRIKNETLLIWGDKDYSTPLKDAYKLRKIIPNSALIILKNTEHYSYLNNPTLTNKIIYEFIKKEH